MTDPRDDDLRVTYERLDEELDALEETEDAKQRIQPGTRDHVRLARTAHERARRVQDLAAAERELAEDIAARRGVN